MTTTARATGASVFPNLAKSDLTWRVPVQLRGPNGAEMLLGSGEPVMTVTASDMVGVEAMDSLDELMIAEAYMAGSIDFEGDLIAGFALRDNLTTRSAPVIVKNHLLPLVKGRAEANKEWIATHYEMDNIQLYAVDSVYGVYTPGIYLNEDDTLEEGAERKLQAAFDSLQLDEGARLLDVGCGWGGFLRFASSRGVEATGITLSQHQRDHAMKRLANDGLEATVLYQDFFSFDPKEKFDAISLMGVIEDLAAYRRVMPRLAQWLKPGGRIYADFAASDDRFGITSFVTKHIWPGRFRLVYMPQFIAAASKSGLDIVNIENDRRNYHLWAKKGMDRWQPQRQEIVAASDDRTYRLMTLLIAGTAEMFSPNSARATAYRVTLGPRE
ncbi:MAG: SAM-dependent methyltransferase [Acidimicrobiia bacterium]